MGLTEFYYIEAGLAFGFVVAVGVAVISYARPAYELARVCAWLAAFLFVSIAVMWGITTKYTPSVWIPAVAIVGALGAVGLVGSLRAINIAQAQITEPDKPPSLGDGPIINNQGIITEGQTGGTNTVIQEPPPRVLGPVDRQALLQRLSKPAFPR